MTTIKVTSWNVEHLARLMDAELSANETKRRDAIIQEIRDIAPDILCLLEAPKGEEAIDTIATQLLGGDWLAVKASDGEYAIQGNQWIWFLVRKELHEHASLLPVATWDAFTAKSWSVHYWGEFTEEQHRHFRHPQVLVLNQNGFRVEFIGLHLKSKFVNQGESMWNAGGAEREQFIRETLKARIKLTTEAINVRAYIDAKFKQVEKPAIFVMGDLNDGPGKELFEETYLFFDLISNLQGDVFFASRFLNHALFDYPDDLRWSVTFEDFVMDNQKRNILLDHIMFTQGLVDGSLPWHIAAQAGTVEHEIHDLINATLPSKAKTSDHKPVSLLVTTND